TRAFSPAPSILSSTWWLDSLLTAFKTKSLVYICSVGGLIHFASPELTSFNLQQHQSLRNYSSRYDRTLGHRERRRKHERWKWADYKAALRARKATPLNALFPLTTSQP